ncbi:hypothetical protein SRB5_46810 [Streptomyces sp. RB5]|uniref:SsuA/THI5-like domain-containing protein n=1 Tax=Streptomyces smaragdinus TaxID=2585196 RepID=A0A7K0CML4_9ACTN|nr:ABC transporter substrate-binding protein [Streptomyces smaragdinus]MQY14513.1 hypothetical protein [Streptomyces smaragdinus]
MTFRRSAKLGASVFSISLVLAAATACGSDEEKTAANGDPTVVFQTIPASTSALLAAQIDAAGLEKKYHVNVEVKAAGSLNASFQEFITGRSDCIVGDPYSFGLKASDGLPIHVAATIASTGGYVLADEKSGIKTPADLKGKRLASAVGGSLHLLMDTAAQNWYGTSFEDDVNVIQSESAPAIAQLAAGKLDATLTYETSASALFNKAKNFHVAYDMGPDYQKNLGVDELWQTVLLCRKDHNLETKTVGQFTAMLKDAGEQLNKDPKATDALAVSSFDAEPNAYGEAFKSGRLAFNIRPVDAGVAKSITDVVGLMTKTGTMEKFDLPADYLKAE